MHGTWCVLAFGLLAPGPVRADTLTHVARSARRPELIQRCAELRAQLLGSGVRGPEARGLLSSIQTEYDRLRADDNAGQAGSVPCGTTALGLTAGSALRNTSAPTVHIAGGGSAADEECNRSATVCLNTGIQTVPCLGELAGPTARAACCVACGASVCLPVLAVIVYRAIRDRPTPDADESSSPDERLNALIARYNALMRSAASALP